MRARVLIEPPTDIGSLLLVASSTVENYLKAILQLEASGVASVGSIAEELSVTPGTVSAMLKQLSEQKLVKYVPRRHVSLLAKGRREALAVVRRHRIIETFLVTTMGFDWSEVHAEAEVLEHVVSDRLLTRMDEMLGHPSHDPHGDPIPGRDGEMPQATSSLVLAHAPDGKYRLAQVDDSDPDFLNWLSEHGLQPGSGFVLDTAQRVAGLLSLTLKSGTKVPVSLPAAGRMTIQAVAVDSVHE